MIAFTTAHLAYALLRAGGASRSLQAAKALERGRARATGEAMVRQEAQLAVAGRLAPELLEQFREASHRLATITLQGGGSGPMQEMLTITEDSAELHVPQELAAMRALDEQLAGYEEAREAHTTYGEVVALIRQSLPGFLRPYDGLEAAVKELRADAVDLRRSHSGWIRSSAHEIIYDSGYACCRGMVG